MIACLILWYMIAGLILWIYIYIYHTMYVIYTFCWRCCGYHINYHIFLHQDDPNGDMMDMINILFLTAGISTCPRLMSIENIMLLGSTGNGTKSNGTMAYHGISWHIMAYHGIF
jgi:hypothetical protein